MEAASVGDFEMFGGQFSFTVAIEPDIGQLHITCVHGGARVALVVDFEEMALGQRNFTVAMETSIGPCDASCFWASRWATRRMVGVMVTRGQRERGIRMR